MKKILSAILVVAMVAVMALPIASAELSPLLPYTGEEVVYNGFWDEYNQTWDTNLKTEFPIDQYFAERTGNVRVEWEPIFGDAQQKTQLMMTTGDVPDIIVTINMYDKLNDYDMSYYLDLRDYAEYMPNLMALYEQYPAYDNLRGENGEIYWIPQPVVSDHADECMYVNMDALNALGLEVPETWDEMLAAMKAYKEANPDKYPFNMPYNWGIGTWLRYLACMVGGTPGVVYYDDAASTWKYALTEETSGYKYIVETLAMLYEEGYIAYDSFTRTDAEGRDVMSKGDYLFAICYTGEPWGAEVNSVENNLNISVMKTPQIAEGQPGKVPVTRHAGMYNYDGAIISKDVQNPELLCSLVDSWIAEETQILNAFGVEGVTYELNEEGIPTYLPEYQTKEARDAYGLNKNIEVYGMFEYVQWDLTTFPILPAEELSDRSKASAAVVRWLNNGDMVLFDDGLHTSVMSEEGEETYSANMTPINTYIDENLYLFAEGQRPMSEWEDFVQETLAYGDIEAVIAALNEGELVSYSDDYQFMNVPSIY